MESHCHAGYSRFLNSKTFVIEFRSITRPSSSLGKGFTTGLAVWVEVGSLADPNRTVTCTSAQASKIKDSGVVHRTIIPDSYAQKKNKKNQPQVQPFANLYAGMEYSPIS